MSGCLLAGTMAIALAPGGAFSIEWSHSVEKIRWHEDWQLAPEGLILRRAAVKGSGAGMEPGPGGHLEDGWWVWVPDLPPQRELRLAASGETGQGWQVCGTECVTLGADAGAPLILRPCPNAPEAG